MKEELRELYKYRELLYMITYRDIKVRYKQSVMGFLWAVLMPVLIVRIRRCCSLRVRLGLRETDADGGHRERGGEVVALGISGFQHPVFLQQPHRKSEFGDQDLFSERDFSHGGGIGQPLRFLRGVRSAADFSADHCGSDGAYNSFWVPLLLLTMVVLAVGIGMIVSAASLFFRDVKYIVEVFLTFGIFFTPVFYDVRMLGDKGKWLLLNPVSPDPGGLSACIVRHQPRIYPGLLTAPALRLVVLWADTSSSSIWSRPLRKAFNRET